MSGEFESYLSRFVEQIKKEKMDMVKSWIKDYRGKIINLKTPVKAFHIVFTVNDVSLRIGEYPSAEATYRGDEKVLIEILKGETKGPDEVRKGRLKLWGSLNEALAFERIAKTIKV